ncbi:MAG: D-aminoacyl-tRNA deacylase, partial [Microbacteriaceae bacterium]
MRVLVQRVTSARVVVDDATVGEINPDGHGLLALVGITHSDDADVAEKMAEKLWRLRIFDDELA